MNRRQIDNLLERWGNSQKERSRDIGYPGESQIGRFRREGVLPPPDGVFSDPTASKARRITRLSMLDYHVRRLERPWLLVVVLRYVEKRQWSDIAELLGQSELRCKHRLRDVQEMLIYKLEPVMDQTPEEHMFLATMIGSPPCIS